MQDIFENNFMNEKCVLIFSQNVSQNCLIITKIQPVDTANVKQSGVKHWLLLSDCSEILIFKWDFRKIHKRSEINCSCGGTDREKDGHDVSNSCTFQFWNAVTKATQISRFIHLHAQIATFPCRCQELIPFLSVTYPFPATLFQQLDLNRHSPHLDIYFLFYLSILFFPNSYTGCHRRNGPNFGRVFLMLNYTDITLNTYVPSWTVIEIMAK